MADSPRCSAHTLLERIKNEGVSWLDLSFLEFFIPLKSRHGNMEVICILPRWGFHIKRLAERKEESRFHVCTTLRSIVQRSWQAARCTLTWRGMLPYRSLWGCKNDEDIYIFSVFLLIFFKGPYTRVVYTVHAGVFHHSLIHSIPTIPLTWFTSMQENHENLQSFVFVTIF